MFWKLIVLFVKLLLMKSGDAERLFQALQFIKETAGLFSVRKCSLVHLYQSAYRLHYSIETALSSPDLLTMLLLSLALLQILQFDNHFIFLERLSNLESLHIPVTSTIRSFYLVISRCVLSKFLFIQLPFMAV